MKTNYHMHTTRCKHAQGTDEAFVLSAINGGFSEIGFSDHCPWPFVGDYVSRIRMDVAQLEDYVQSISSLRAKYQNQISIKIGLECEYYEEFIPWLKKLKEAYQLDYLIFGNHFPENEMRSYYFGSKTKTKKELDDYLQSAIKGMESGLFAYFAHPDLFMVSYESFDEECERISRLICQKASELKIPLEFNLSGYIYQETRGITTYPSLNFWRIAKEYNCDAIIGYDAHEFTVYESDVYYNRAKQTLAELGIHVISSLPLK